MHVLLIQLLGFILLCGNTNKVWTVSIFRTNYWKERWPSILIEDDEHWLIIANYLKAESGERISFLPTPLLNFAKLLLFPTLLF